MIYAANIVHETLDGETIVINLETGSYFSLTGSGAEIWGLLGAGGSVSEICAALALRHAQPESQISGAVASFVADLEREGLVEPGGSASNGQRTEPPEADGPWELPQLERYDDMRSFLLVDPIHEVDESGWPRVKTAQ